MLQTLKKQMMITIMLVGDSLIASMKGPCRWLLTLVNNTKWVTAQAKMNTQCTASESKKK